MDFNRVGLLLNICELANKWPKLKALHDKAMTELEQIMDEAKEALPEPKSTPVNRTTPIATQRRE